MLFNTYAFLFVFLPCMLMLYYGAIWYGSRSLARLSLLVGSCFFYAFWDYRYLPLLLLSIAMNYAIGGRIAASVKKRKGWLLLGLGANLTLLFVYKYLAFAASLIGIPMEPLTLPLGISFFTFTQIAFLVDAYYDKIETLDPVSYGLFVTIFPHLIAGPILHHREMIGQFNQNSTFRCNHGLIGKGLFLFALGMGKKVLIADRLSPLVEAVFDTPHAVLSFWDAWGASLAYTLQLYFDFSGYSDMAIGLGWMFNLHLPMNFNSPYKAASIIDFWRRWHMTLSQFLRDYVYIPLGGNRHGEGKKYRNLFLTMLIGGVWHGAGWPFIIWGALHGSYLLANHAWNKWFPPMPTVFAWPLTFFAVVVAWVFFRAPDLASAGHVLSAMGGFQSVELPPSIAALFASWFGEEWLSLSGLTAVSPKEMAAILVVLLVAFIAPNSHYWTERFQMKRRFALTAAALLVSSMLFFNKATEFLYYQF